MKLKKIILTIVCIFMILPVFSQTAAVASIGITDSDVKSFIKNYDKINNELEKLDCEVSTLSVTTETEAAEKIEKVLVKNGVTNPNAFAKLLTIYSTVTIETYERIMSSDPTTSALMKQINGGKDPYETTRATINDKDYNTILKYYSDLCKVFEIEEAAVSNSGDSNKEEFWTDEDTKELKESIKNDVKNDIKNKAREDVMNGLRRGARDILPF